MSNRKIHDLSTPALLLDLLTMEANLQKMANFFSESNTRLRPHFKNHQSAWLAAKQIDAGAIGITCATVEQAEVLVSQGIRSVLIASEITDEARIGRLAELARRAEIIAVIDNARIVADMARIARNRKGPLKVLIDVDVGLNRCGVLPGEPALSLALAAAGQELMVCGVMGYEGHLQLSPQSPEKKGACHAALQSVVDTRNLFERHGVRCQIVSAGGTGTYSITGRYPGITEVQAGSYLTMDTSYFQFVQDFEPALSVLATVISKTEGKRVVVDAGKKALSSERGLPEVKGLEGLRLMALHSEHAIIEIQDSAAPVEVGDKIEIWVHYSDATVQLHEQMYGVEENEVKAELNIGR